jgi:uncharacterized membrane protein
LRKDYLVNIALWVVQVFLAVYFFSTGVIHIILPAGLPGPMGWMYDLPRIWHYVSGIAEILAGIGLILPGITRIRSHLVPLAAAGLVIVMASAAVWHLGRGEFTNIFMNVVLAALAGFVAYGRWRLSPIPSREAAG